MLRRKFDEFFSSDAAGGVMLMLSAVAALMIANSSLNPEYQEFLSAYIGITVNGEGIEKAALLWINDGLMAIFFFLIGLELKRELMEGKLKNPANVVLPGMAAVGGMIVPALVYLVFNWGNDATAQGWAIPAATDIAFALGVLALLGSRVPPSLKIFLLTLAILDDMGAILIIALFYTAELKLDYLFLAVIPLALMIWRNLRGTHRMAPILLLGVVMWVFVLKSGVHATLAGVITAFCIPLKDRWNKSPLHSLENGLSPYVLYVIVPLFAFANAGVVLKDMSLQSLVDPVPLGVALGLIIGKQVGVFGATWLMVKFGLARLPHAVTWAHIYGLACLAGIGFTMSLFIGSLSFSDAALMNEVRLGVLLGSGFSALVGYFVLRAATRPGTENEPEALNQPGAAERTEAAAE